VCFILKIEDTGIGIQEEYRNTIFEAFKELHSDADYKSTGIGLSVCQKKMTLYDGKISTVDNSQKRNNIYPSCPLKMHFN